LFKLVTYIWKWNWNIITNYEDEIESAGERNIDVNEERKVDEEDAEELEEEDIDIFELEIKGTLAEVKVEVIGIVDVVVVVVEMEEGGDNEEAEKIGGAGSEG